MPVEERILRDGSVVCRSREYARREELPDTPDAAKVVVGISDCQEQDFAAEHETLKQITGRYQNKGWAASVNQAGDQICVWLVEQPEFMDQKWGDVVEIYGEADDASGIKWGLYDAADDLVGELNVLGSGKIELRTDDRGELGELLRVDERATLSQRAISDLASVAGALADQRGADVLDMEHKPYPARWTRHLEASLISDEFRTKMQTVIKHKPSGDMDTDLSARIRGLLKYLRDEVAMPMFGLQASETKDLDDILIKGWPGKELFQVVVSMVLQEETKLYQPDGVTRTDTYFGWLERIAGFAKESCKSLIPVDLDRLLSRFLGIAPHPHIYKINIDLVGTAYEVDLGGKIAKKVGKKAAKRFGKEWGEFVEKLVDEVQVHAGAKVFGGQITFESDNPQWTSTRAIALTFANAGRGSASTGDTLEFKGTGSVRTETVWGPKDFDGTLTFFGGAASYLDGKKMAARFLLEGSGPNRSVIANIEKLEADLPLGGVELGWGRIFKIWDKTKIIPPPKLKFEDATLEYFDASNFQFHLSSATLRDNGQVVLKKWAARELALLADGKTDLQIMGFADRLGRKWYNDVLSESRAANVARALRAALGTRLNATTTVSSYGERHLEILDKYLNFPSPDGKASPEWRRVIVMLSEQLALTLVVEDNSP